MVQSVQGANVFKWIAITAFPSLYFSCEWRLLAWWDAMKQTISKTRPKYIVYFLTSPLNWEPPHAPYAPPCCCEVNHATRACISMGSPPIVSLLCKIWAFGSTCFVRRWAKLQPQRRRQKPVADISLDSDSSSVITFAFTPTVSWILLQRHRVRRQFMLAVCARSLTVLA